MPRTLPAAGEGTGVGAGAGSGPDCGGGAVAGVLWEAGIAEGITGRFAVRGPGDRCRVEDVIGGCLTSWAEVVRDADAVAGQEVTSMVLPGPGLLGVLQ